MKIKYYLILMVLIFTPQLIFFGKIFNTLYLVIFSSIIYLIKNKFKIPAFKNYLVLLFIILIFFCFITLINGNVEFSILKQLLLFPIFLLAFRFFIEYYIKKYSIESFFKLLLYCLTINSVIILVLVIFPNLNFIFHEFIHISPKQYKLIYIDQGFVSLRHSGFAFSGFSYLSIKYALLYTILFFYNLRNDFKKEFIISSFIIILSLIFVARTGLYIILIQFLIFLLIKGKKIFLYSTLLLVAPFIYFFDFEFYLSFVNSINRSFDIFQNIFLENNFSNPTIKDLKYELIFPDNLKHWLIGMGDFGRDFGLVTDIGFLTFINGSGLIGLFIFFSIYFYAFLKSISCKFKFLKHSIYAIVFLTLLFNFKDLVYLDHGYSQAFCICLVLIEFYKNENRNLRSFV